MTGKKGMGMGTLIALAIPLAFLALVLVPGAVKAWNKGRGSDLASKYVCSKLCPMRRGGDWTHGKFWEVGKLASEAGFGAGINAEDCCCGSSGDSGSMMHIMLNADAGLTGDGEEIWEFHLTNHDPRTHSKYRVPDMFNHRNSCWKFINSDWSKYVGEGCLILAVERDDINNNDDCSLWVAKNGSVINGTASGVDSLFRDCGQEADCKKVKGWTDDFDEVDKKEKYWNNFYDREFTRYCGKRRACQKELLLEPTCGLSKKPELFTTVKCSYDPVNQRYKWMVNQSV